MRRPKLDLAGQSYTFEQEKALQLEKMRTVLRIAALHDHKDICIGSFGTGPTFRNPMKEVAKMWKELLFHEEEFYGVFANVVFAIDTNLCSGRKNGISEYEVIRDEFDPRSIFRTVYR